MTAMANTAMAIPCSFTGKVCRRMACSVGCRAPAPSPWMARKMTSPTGFARRRRASSPPRTGPGRTCRRASARRGAQEAGEGHHQHGGYHEPGGDPGDLLRGGADRTADVGDGDVHDRRVDRAHQGAEGTETRHQPLVHRRADGGHRRQATPARRRRRRSSMSPRPTEEELDHFVHLVFQ